MTDLVPIAQDERLFVAIARRSVAHLLRDIPRTPWQITVRNWFGWSQVTIPAPPPPSLRMGLILENPPDSGVRLTTYRFVASDPWEFVYAPRPVGEPVEIYNLQFQSAKRSKAKAWVVLGTGLDGNGTRWGRLDDQSPIMVPADTCVGIDMLIHEQGSLAIHFWEDRVS